MHPLSRQYLLWSFLPFSETCLLRTSFAGQLLPFPVFLFLSACLHSKYTASVPLLGEPGVWSSDRRFFTADCLMLRRINFESKIKHVQNFQTQVVIKLVKFVNLHTRICLASKKLTPRYTYLILLKSYMLLLPQMSQTEY